MTNWCIDQLKNEGYSSGTYVPYKIKGVTPPGTDRSKAVVPVLLFLFCVALWFILRGGGGASCLVLPCSLLALWSPRLGKRELEYVFLVHLCVYFACVNFCPFSLHLGGPAPIAQLVEFPLLGTGGHGFDPGPRHTKVPHVKCLGHDTSVRQHYKCEHWASCRNQTPSWYDWKIVESDVKPEYTHTHTLHLGTSWTFLLTL